MKLTEKQQYAIEWLKEIQSKFHKDITLRWVDDYWEFVLLQCLKMGQ